ncbi:MAG TPA: flagellar export chaperone FliS [Polyangiaceae bacterium]|nr:flagellar export chaperone FliS [Polyangiaceae bacterium]
MIPAHIAQYKSVQIRTSSPGELLIAHYDGLFKFLLLSKISIERKKVAEASEAISRAHAILSELYVSLDHSQYPELCKNLSALYDYCLQRLLYANRHRKAEVVEEVMRLLTPVREANTIVVRQMAGQAQNPQGRGGGR